ncbi:MAG: hypothetical protein ACRDAM_17205 [Casimicrobium sp.]
MALKIEVDSLDTIPEASRSLYVEKDGRFRLDLEGYEDPVGLKSALQKEREAAKTAAQQAKAWQSLGKTPEEIAALVEASKKAEEEKALKGGEWEKLKEQMKKQQQEELTKKDQQLSAKDKALTRHLVDAQAVAELATAKGSTALLLPHIRSMVKVIEEEGDYVVRVVDAAGNPRVNGKGEFLTIKDLVSEMRQSDDYSRAFEPTGTTGSGVSGSGATGSSKVIKKDAFDALRPAERAKRIGEGYKVID